MHDFLQQGAALASETEGDQQAKLRSFGDALYAPCLLNDHELVDFLRKRNSDDDVMWLTAIVEKLCPSLQPTKPAARSAKLGGRHYINALRDIKTRYERLKKDEESDHSAAAEAEAAAAAAAVQQQTEVSVAAQPDTSLEGWQKAAWGSYTVPELKARLKSNGLVLSGKKVPAPCPFACAARARPLCLRRPRARSSHTCKSNHPDSS
jgi:hypothetical protein